MTDCVHHFVIMSALGRGVTLQNQSKWTVKNVWQLFSILRVEQKHTVMGCSKHKIRNQKYPCNVVNNRTSVT
jgi:hypothetical protein